MNSQTAFHLFHGWRVLSQLGRATIALAHVQIQLGDSCTLSIAYTLGSPGTYFTELGNAKIYEPDRDAPAHTRLQD